MARQRATCAAAEARIAKAGGKSISLEADASDPESMATAFAEARRELGPVDVLVYNAGALQIATVLDTSPEDFERCWKANCFGAFLAAREAAPSMVERGRGTVLFTGATAAHRGGAKFSCLAVGKFGLRALAQSLARELGPSGVHVAHVVIDGIIDGPRSRALFPDYPEEKMLDPDAIAETYWQLHVQPRSCWTLEIDVRPSVEKF